MRLSPVGLGKRIRQRPLNELKLVGGDKPIQVQSQFIHHPRQSLPRIRQRRAQHGDNAPAAREQIPQYEMTQETRGPGHEDCS